MNLTWDEQPDGYRVMDGPHLIARLTTKTQGQKEVTTVNGTVKVVDWLPMEPKDWTIHWANPQMPAAVVAAVAASLPAKA